MWHGQGVAGLGVLAGMLLAAAAWGADGRVGLDRFMVGMGFDAPRVEAGAIRFDSRWSRLEFEPASRRFRYNGVLIYLNDGLRKAGDDWTLAEADARDIVGALLQPPRSLASQRVETVVLDAGHGGHDKGAVSPRRVEEKRVTLDVASRVRRKLAAAGVRVQMTRARDAYLSLDQRSAFANKVKADVFVSIHMNSTGDRSVAGVETFVLASPGFPPTAGGLVAERDRLAYAGNRAGPASALLGYHLQRSLAQHTGAGDRGVKRARFAVLRDVSCPAVLVECGFLSNPGEEAKLIERKYRDEVAEGLARGILAYIAETRKAGMPSGR